VFSIILNYYHERQSSGTKSKGFDWKEVNRVYQQFQNADTNNACTISFQEMAVVFRKVVPQLTETHYSIEFGKINANKSGYVDFMEYPKKYITNYKLS
jgi:Ca2+-binding EF-hand superfamily protein